MTASRILTQLAWIFASVVVTWVIKADLPTFCCVSIGFLVLFLMTRRAYITGKHKTLHLRPRIRCPIKELCPTDYWCNHSFLHQSVNPFYQSYKEGLRKPVCVLCLWFVFLHHLYAQHCITLVSNLKLDSI